MNSNFALCVLTDTARTISASHTWSAAQLFADGAVGAPGVAFSNDTNSGLYRIGADNIGLALGGAKVVDFAAAGVTVTGTLTASGAATLQSTLAVTGAATLSSTLGVTGAATLSSTLAVTGVITASAKAQLQAGARLPDGNSGAPALQIGEDTLGFYRSGAATLAHTGSIASLTLAASGFLRAPDGTSLAPSVRIGQDDLGFYRSTTDTVAASKNLSVAGTFAVTGASTLSSLTLSGALSGVTTLGLSGQLTSTLATGTAPFSVTSTTVCTNLNADLLDGQHGSYYSDAGNLTGTVASARLSGAYTGVTGLGTLTSLTISGALTAGSLNLGGATVTDILSATAVWDIPSTAADAFQNTTVTVTGAAVGDLVLVSEVHRADSFGNYVTGYVSGADTVTLVYQNLSSLTQDPTSRTVRVVVFKF